MNQHTKDAMIGAKFTDVNPPSHLKSLKLLAALESTRLQLVLVIVLLPLDGDCFFPDNSGLELT